MTRNSHSLPSVGQHQYFWCITNTNWYLMLCSILIQHTLQAAIHTNDTDDTVYGKTFEGKTFVVFANFSLTVKVFPDMFCSINA